MWGNYRMSSKRARFCNMLFASLIVMAGPTAAHDFGVLNIDRPKKPASGDAPSAIQEPITFQGVMIGAAIDPTGLFSDAELEEGGSTVQPPIWHSTFPVDGGEVTLAILVDRWCGLSECPFRFVIQADNGMRLHSHNPPAHGMMCQDRSSITVDPIKLVLTACGTEIDLKQAWPL